MKFKLRPTILLGQAILGAAMIMLAIDGHVEAAIGIAGIIGLTMQKIIDLEGK